MSSIYNLCLFHWQDHNGKPAISFLSTVDQTAGGSTAYEPLASAMQDCCEAGIVAIQFQQTVVLSPTIGTGPYSTVWDRGVLKGRNSVTNVLQATPLVGPKADIFLPDTITINLSDTRILAVQSQVMSLLGDSLGNYRGPFIRGYRSKESGS